MADLEEAEGSFSNPAPKGLLRVNLQGTLARHFVVPSLAGASGALPGHRTDDRRRRPAGRIVVREGVGCVLRAATCRDSSMVGRRVALLPQVTVASPAYLEKYGEPADPVGARRAPRR